MIDLDMMQAEVAAVREYLKSEGAIIEKESVNDVRDLYCFSIRSDSTRRRVRVTDSFFLVTKGAAVAEFLRRHGLAQRIRTLAEGKALLVTTDDIVEEPI